MSLLVSTWSPILPLPLSPCSRTNWCITSVTEMYNIGAYILFLPIPSPITIGRWWRGEEDDGCARRRRLITCRSAWKTLPAPCSWEINMCLHVIPCILRARINRHFITWENIMITILCRQPAQYRPAEWVDGNKRTAIIPLPTSSTRKPQSIYQMKHVEGSLSLSLSSYIFSPTLQRILF